MLLSEICKRFITLDVSGFVDFIILERRKYNGILPPADRPSDKFSDLWLPTSKQMPSSIESHHIQVPDNIVLRNGQNLPNQRETYVTKSFQIKQRLCPDKAKKSS